MRWPSHAYCCIAMRWFFAATQKPNFSNKNYLRRGPRRTKLSYYENYMCTVLVAEHWHIPQAAWILARVFAITLMGFLLPWLLGRQCTYPAGGRIHLVQLTVKRLAKCSLRILARACCQLLSSGKEDYSVVCSVDMEIPKSNNVLYRLLHDLR